jgi:hypothetical protein
VQRIALEAQTYGTTQAFGIAVWMMVAVTVITLVGLSIRHEELATDATDQPAPTPAIPPPARSPEDGAGPAASPSRASGEPGAQP